MPEPETKKIEEIDRVTFLFDVLKRYDHYIATSNFKIGLHLSFLIAVLVFLLTLGTQPWGNSTYILLSTNLGKGMLVLAFVIILISIGFLISAVTPSFKTPESYKSLIFFGDVKSKETPTDYFEAYKEISDEKLYKDLASQTYIMAAITDNKFKLITRASNLTKWGVLPLVFITICLFIFEVKI